MEKFHTVTGHAIPLGRPNVDTDLIIPARYLKTVTRDGMGRGAFETLRFKADGAEDPDSVFNQPRYRGAPILIAGDNFGCGSSREHAAWALDDLGIKAIIAPSFSDIFSGNAYKNGLLAVVLPQPVIDRLLEIAPDGDVTVDLENQVVTTSHQDRFQFEIDPFRKRCLMQGLDEIGLTMEMAGDIGKFEKTLDFGRPWLGGKAGPNRGARS